MGLTPESVEEFRAAKHSLLLGDAEISSLKLEVEAEVPPSKRSKKRGQQALDDSHISAVPVKRKKGELANTDTPVSPTKRKFALEDPDVSASPMKKGKGL